MSSNIPQLDAAWFQNICQLGPFPLVATGMFKLWLQGHFGSLSNLESPTSGGLGHSIWTPQLNTTGIIIESITRWIPPTAERRPSIVIKRNKWSKIRLGINDLLMLPQTGIDGSLSYTNWWQGSHTLFCIAGEGSEAEILGAEVFREINEFSQTVRRILELKKLQVVDVDEVRLLKANARENFVVPVTIMYMWEEAYNVSQNASLLRRMLTNLNIIDLQP